MIDSIVEQLPTYGPFIIAIVFWLAEVGLPIPIAILMVAIGGLGRQGLLNWQLNFIVAFVAVVIGDSTSYWLGRLTGDWLRGRVRRFRQEAWEKAEGQFERYGAWAILLTRTVINSLDVPTNFIAGGSRYPFPRFLAVDLLGRAIWVLFNGGIGLLVGSRWREIADLIQQQTWKVGLVALAAVAVFLLVRRFRQRGELGR